MVAKPKIESDVSELDPAYVVAIEDARAEVDAGRRFYRTRCAAGCSRGATVKHTIVGHNPREVRAQSQPLSDLTAIRLRCAALPVLDERQPDDIIGYDEHGLPAAKGIR